MAYLLRNIILSTYSATLMLWGRFLLFIFVWKTLVQMLIWSRYIAVSESVKLAYYNNLLVPHIFFRILIQEILHYITPSLDLRLFRRTYYKGEFNKLKICLLL